MKPSLPFFEPKKGFYVTTENLIAIGFTVLLFLMVYTKAYFGYSFGNWIIYFSIIWLVYISGLLFSNFFRYEREIGEYRGVIVLGSSSISFDGVSYELENIKKISFNSNNIKGEFMGYRAFFTPSLSNGLNNSISLDLVTGDKVEAIFLQTKTRRLKSYKEILTFYYLENKFSWLHLLDVLKMNNYEEIQLFKKEIHLN